MAFGEGSRGRIGLGVAIEIGRAQIAGAAAIAVAGAHTSRQGQRRSQRTHNKTHAHAQSPDLPAESSPGHGAAEAVQTVTVDFRYTEPGKGPGAVWATVLKQGKNPSTIRMSESFWLSQREECLEEFIEICGEHEGQ